ncbi:unnamed protein product, partial [Closterium sp. NIES-54]
MPSCPHALMSSCPHALMPSCPHVLMPSCPHVLMPSCPHALMPSCPHALMPSCHHAIMPSCHHAIMPSCHHAIMPSCLHAIMPSCHHAFMPSCLHAIMPSCLHAFMLSCHDAVKPSCHQAQVRALPHPHQGRHPSPKFLTKNTPLRLLPLRSSSTPSSLSPSPHTRGTIPLLTNWFSLAPRTPKDHLALACCRQALGHMAHAVSAFTRIIDTPSDPEDAPILFHAFYQ